MKQFAWISLGCLMLVTAQAASFDCAKATAKLERLICGDAKLSKLDEEMAVLYGEILTASSNDPVLKKAQRDWLKYRETCLAADYKQKESICLSYLYRRHMNILRGSLPTEPDADKNTSQLCSHMSALVETGEASKLEPKYYVNNSASRGKDYKFDIDGDGVADSLQIGCGSSECDVEIKLSSASPYDLGSLNDSSGFYLIRYQSRMYALSSYSEDDESKDEAMHHKYHLGRLYLMAPTKAILMCGKQP